MNITLHISKQAVLDEVAQKSAYTAAKMGGEEDVFDKISTVDEDENELMKFFDECRAELSERMLSMLSSEGMTAGGATYEIVLNLHDGFNTAMTTSLELCLFNYFVYGILYRWYLYTNKDEAEVYAMKSAEMLNSVWSKSIKKVFTRGMNPF